MSYHVLQGPRPIIDSIYSALSTLESIHSNFSSTHNVHATATPPAFQAGINSDLANSGWRDPLTA